jgi:integrase
LIRTKMVTKAKKSKRRNRTPHTGVKIKKMNRQNGTTYVARWIDPLTGKECQQAFSKLRPSITTHKGREAWAINKARSLSDVRAAMSSGMSVSTETPLPEAIDAYFSAATAEGLKATTLTAYSVGTSPLLAWCVKNSVEMVEQLTGPKLESFRKWYIAQKAKVPAKGKGAGKGSWESGTKRRSPRSINKGLAAVRTVLNQWRREGLLPHLTADEITDRMRAVKSTHETPHFLRSSAIKSLLKAAQRHDKASYSFARRGTVNTSGKYQYTPIYEFIVAALLTGCRFAELAELRWDEVNLDAGEIVIQGDRTKTGRGRRISLDVTPALKTLLSTMALRKGDNRFVFTEPADREVKKQKAGRVAGDAGMNRNAADRARKRLIEKFGAPSFTWHDLRRTCGTFLACAPGIYAGAGAFHAAKRLGHSVVVSERHYAGAITDIPKKAETLEEAMSIGQTLATPTKIRRKGRTV